MRSLWLWILVIRTVYANADYADYYTDSSESDESPFTYADHYTHCKDDASIFIRCNITLTEQNRKEYTSKFAAQFKTDLMRRIILKCISCNLETFPNEILSNESEWREFDFESSHIKYLKMNALHSSLANTIRILHLSNNSITHLDEESLPQSHTLMGLDLSHNLITHVTGLYTFAKLTGLDALNLAYNSIAHLDPLVFQNMSNIQHLNLNNNMLFETSFVSHLRHPYATLTLSNNPIVKLEKEIFISTIRISNSSITNYSIGPYLKFLSIVDANLQTIDLSNATRLILLNLSSNHLTSFEWKNPRDIYLLDLYNNNLQTINIGHTFSLRSLNLARNNFTSTRNMSLPVLKELNLSHNKFVNIEHEFFKNLTSLRDLNLAHCGLHTLNTEMFIPFSIEILDLSYNNLSNLDLSIFKGLTELEQLNLNGNRLTDIKVEDLRNTTRIGISNNDWKCERLKVIVDILNLRNGIIFLEPCVQHCKENISDIACRSDRYVANLPSAEEPSENTEADERFRSKENIMWKEVQANISMHTQKKAHNHNLTHIVHEITLELYNILEDVQRQHISINSENYTEHKSEMINLNERVEHLQEKTNRLLAQFITSTAGNGSSNVDIAIPITMRNNSSHLDASKDHKPHSAAIISIIIVILVMFVAAVITFGVVLLRKRRAHSYNYIATFTEQH